MSAKTFQHWQRRLPEVAKWDEVEEYEQALQIALAQFRKMAALEADILAIAKKHYTDDEIDKARRFSTFTECLASRLEPEAWREFFEGEGTCANMDGWKCIESLTHAKRATDWLTD